MAGGRKKNKYRKMHPDKGQGENAEKEGSTNQLELQEPAEPCKSKKKKRRKQKKERSSKKVHLSPLPDRYEPLEENVEDQECKEDKRYKRKQKVKKYAKNFGKAVRTAGRYMLIGLQGLANAYVAPFGVTSVVLSTAAR
ncbi:required for drug-induced death protein 1 [Anomaloglossus baeobatrachus]|uniref:required for drug-induced death protein 1 n=1 Tax=Anomaloglossus baeobatrachus TaxID=238106 RepID=UPI003F5020A4